MRCRKKTTVYSHPSQPPSAAYWWRQCSPHRLRPILPPTYLYPNQITLHLRTIPSARCHFLPRMTSFRSGNFVTYISPRNLTWAPWKKPKKEDFFSAHKRCDICLVGVVVARKREKRAGLRSLGKMKGTHTSTPYAVPLPTEKNKDKNTQCSRLGSST